MARKARPRSGPEQAGDAPDSDPAWRERIRSHLVDWYGHAHRPLPWRADGDPYRILVSETMLVQTTVAAVVPYFERFLARFPTVRDLAEADEADVVKAWEGLGYYRRARQLHAAAKAVVRDHAGL
ncbi:MAG TPA: A/G-specific adenine glycosylase, partial [Isosphaeraceae bacterium]